MPPKSKLTSASDSGATLETQSDSSATKLKPEDFADLLSDPRVLEALTKALAPLKNSIEAALDKKIDSLGATLRALKADNGRLAAQCRALSTESGELNKHISS